jgi:hypothetical protein
MDLPERHQSTSDEERRIREAALDKTIADSFPASDPPSSNPNPNDPSALANGTFGNDTKRVRTRSLAPANQSKP